MFFGTAPPARFLHNDGAGALADVTGSAPALNFADARSIAFLDFDGDGDDDVFASFVNRGQLFRRVPGGFVDATSLLPISGPGTRRSSRTSTATAIPTSPAWATS